MGVLGGLILKPTAGIPRAGLVAEYLFSNNYDDTSGNGYNGINSGTALTTDRKSNPNSAIQLNGTSQYVNINAVCSALSGTTIGTHVMWIKPTDAVPSGSNKYILSFGETDDNTLLGNFQKTVGGVVGAYASILLSSSVVEWHKETDTAPFTDNTWAFVATVKTSSGTRITLYIDGVAIAQTFLIGLGSEWFNDIPGIDNARIGCLNYNNNGNIAFFDGCIDDVRIYDIALSGITIEGVKSLVC